MSKTVSIFSTSCFKWIKGFRNTVQPLSTCCCMLTLFILFKSLPTAQCDLHEAIHTNPHFHSPFWLSKIRINMSPKLLEGCCIWKRTYCFYLTSPTFPIYLLFFFLTHYTPRFFLIYFDHHFDSSSSSVVLLFFLPANSLFYEKVIYTCYHSSGKQ